MWLILILILVITVLYRIISTLNYWNNRGVPQVSKLWYIKHNVQLILKQNSLANSVKESYDMFPGNARYGGTLSFSKPTLLIKDPELLKELTVKNFDNFTDHANVISDNKEPLWTRNLFALKGEKWKKMRPILSPSFTSSKMRTMFVLLSDCAKNFSQHFVKKGQDLTEIEFKDVFTRFTNDVIATSAFGLEIDSLENEKNEFYMMGKNLTSFGGGLVLIKFFLIMLVPKLASILGITIFDRKITSFFHKLIDDTIETRKKEDIVRPDMIQLLMQAQKGLEDKEEAMEDSSFAAQEEMNIEGNAANKEPTKMTNLDIAAQALIFFFAGFETVSTLMCFMAYELAINHEFQKRLRREIDETFEKCEGNLTYEGLLKMKYMDMIVSESLRKWPPAVAQDRECTKSYTIQPKLPGEKPIYMDEKSLLFLPIYGIHRDPQYYPDPDKFDPERFSDENKEKIKPYTYIPFGLGPRNCIGSRFALMEVKVVFFHLLRNFELVPTKRSQIPVKLAGGTFNLTADGGFWFGLKRIKVKNNL